MAPSAALHMEGTNQEKDGLRIFTPVGMLGYGFSEKIYWATMKRGVDAVILDSGSTDSGPSKLALGKPTVSRKGYERDLELLLMGCHLYRKPLLIGSAGGDGSNSGVDLLLDIIRNIISEKGLRSMKVLHIYAEIDKDVVRTEHVKGKILPCSGSVPDLQMKDIDDASKIVAQMGIEPWLKAMNESPDFDIIVGGRSYDPSPYAAFCVINSITDMGIAYHMGKLMECGAMCSIPKSREALAIVRNDSFDIEPLDPKSRCTVVSVAAHALYEKSRPDILIGPGGGLHLDTATYKELPDQRTVQVKGARFVPEPADKYTLKLEAARVAGYHSMCFGGIRDPILIPQIDEFLERAKETVREQVCMTDPFDLEFRVYGRDAVMAALEPNRKFVPQEICIVAHARASTQDDATNIIGAARVCLMHGSYPNQRATAGNFAMAFEPYSIPMGMTSDFCMYHLMTVTDPTAHFPIHVQVIEGTNSTSYVPRPSRFESQTNGKKENGTIDSNTDVRLAVADSETPSLLGKIPPAGRVFLADLAKVIRSKNAGPYELTFDIMFADAETCQMVKRTNILNQETVARLYNIQESDVVACLWWDQAFAFKATIKRYRVSGGFWETDSHGSQQYAPFMALTVPIP